MAEALISVALDQLVPIAKRKVRRVKNVKKDVSKLKSNLKAIKVVLEYAEKKQIDVDGGSVMCWLDQLKDVSYDIDNVLDEWHTEILSSKIQKQVDEEEAADEDSHKKKVRIPLPTCFCLTKLKRVGVRHEIALEIEKLRERLDEIAEEKSNFSFETTKSVSSKRPRKTTSLIDVSEVHGRDGDRDYLISKLLSDSGSHGGKGPVIIPIVGMGGIGKTTLAKLAFNDEKVKANFADPPPIWVCVSDPFDEIAVAKAILLELQVDNCQNLDTLQALLQRIREAIEGKKFLLVLDDVWTTDRERWDEFKLPFGDGAVGSRVVITTRKEEVATMMGLKSQMISMKLLSKEHCWLILSQIAFLDRSSEEREQLEEIGRKIASKCKGLPLWAKTLGSLMHSKKTNKRDWEDVLFDRIWESQEDEIKHFAPFFLSYYDLPPLEKRCFSYCSVFPKDYVFDRDELIEIWMSQGYLNCNENPERKGQNCFKNLSMRSFFQDFVKDESGKILTCKMHDILHDFAQFLTKKECCSIKMDDWNTQVGIVEKVRHLTLLSTSSEVELEFNTSMLNQGHLQSLLLLSADPYQVESMRTLLRQTPLPLKYVRTLCLRWDGIGNLPTEVINFAQLRHLRYLDLSRNKQMIELPEEVCDLCNLQTLRIEGCGNLRRLPEGMGKLVNLRHLHIHGCALLQVLPKGIGRLTQLRTLDRVIIPEKNHGEYLSIGDLEKLNHLQFERGLWIERCGNLKTSRELEKGPALLTKLKNCLELRLVFGRYVSDDKPGMEENDFKVLEALQPHPSVKSLFIEDYHGAKLSPKWLMSLDNLTRLGFSCCLQCKALPPLGSLPSLEILDISIFPKVRKIGVEFMGITTTTTSTTTRRSSSSCTNMNDDPDICFPKLKHLSLFALKELKEWEDCEATKASGSITVMPCLHSLDIHCCNSLESLPEFLKLTPLKYLSISDCAILRESCQPSGKEWAKISHIPNITIEHKEVQIDGILRNLSDHSQEVQKSMRCIQRKKLRNQRGR